jgi:hypothetical protein
MSRKQSAGSCLEGKTPVPVDLLPQAGILDGFGKQVDAAAEDFGQAPLQTLETKQTDLGCRVKFDDTVDVACKLSFAAGDRAEHREMADAALAQFGIVSAQCRDHGLGLRGD